MKKYFKIIIIILLIILVVGIGAYILNKNIDITIDEYQPQEEISQEQERQTLVSLYFKNKSTNMVEPEVRLIDVKELVKDPYTTLINMLCQSPKNDNLVSVIPEGTKINSIKVESDILILDLSSDFINNHVGGKEEELATMESIVNTMTELTEINSIKILINGEENKAFKDSQITFEQNFIRED